MKLSEYKGEEAVEVLADILTPAVEIFGDPEIQKSLRSGEAMVKTISTIVKTHKKEVLEILAGLENTPVEEYECTIPDILKKVFEIVNDEDLKAFFISLAKTDSAKSSGEDMENTEDKGDTSSNT